MVTKGVNYNIFVVNSSFSFKGDKMSQYFENSNLPSNIREYETRILGETFKFKTDNGVFSKDKLDFGTRVMLESIPVKELSGDILDLGCGYGVVGIVLSKLCNVNIDAVDVNKRALHLCDLNCKLNNIKGINYLESYCYQAINDKQYDYIITNPPIRAGKEVVYEMLKGAKDHLKKDGILYFVMRKDHGAKTAIKDISNIYNTEIISKEKGFFVIKCFLR